MPHPETYYRDLTGHINANAVKLRQAVPPVMEHFSALSRAALQDGELSKKQKELIAMAIAVTQRCDGCIGFHAKALVGLGATRGELMETLGMCVYMGGGPALMYAAKAVSAFEEFSPPANPPAE
jgi:AhpD family alkylhydroperoxidase